MCCTAKRKHSSGIVSKLAPDTVTHTWVEVLFEGEWVALEGVITDEDYVRGVKNKYPRKDKDFKGCAISVPSLKDLSLDWNGEDLYVQNTSVVEDFGVYDSPDAFFKEHAQTWSKLKDFAYVYYGRKVMNKNVARIRKSV